MISYNYCFVVLYSGTYGTTTSNIHKRFKLYQPFIVS